MSEDLRNFINSCYERSEIGIARRNIFHDRMFKILFKFKDKMTDGELKEELIQIGEDAKGSIFDHYPY
jgi:hypothetical protein